MNRAAKNRRLSCSIAFVLILGLFVGYCHAANRLLVDDFSIDQVGFTTGANVASDFLEDPRLFAGGRDIWGGGANNSGTCATCTMAAGVHDGAFEVIINDIPSGAAAVSWPKLISYSSFGLSDFAFIQLDIDEIVGVIPLRLTFERSSFPNMPAVLVTSASAAGLHKFSLPSELDITTLSSITISAQVDQGETFVLSGVWLVVPEPSSATQVAIFAAIALLAPWRRHPLVVCRT